MAKALAALARSAAVVPTLDPAHCVKLNASALFTFENIPEDFANELIRGAVEFPVGAIRVKLRHAKRRARGDHCRDRKDVREPLRIARPSVSRG